MRGSGQDQRERPGRRHAGHCDRGGGGPDLVPAAFPGRDGVADTVLVRVAHVIQSRFAGSELPARTFSVTSEPLSADPPGNPATVDGVPSWASSDPSIVSVTPAPDGLSAVAESTGNLGNVQISVAADADLGSGVREITAVGDI